jgi:hypothetical protein
MALDAALKKIARLLTRRFGNPLTFERVTQGAYNPATGTYAETVVTENTYGVHEDMAGEHDGDMLVTFVTDEAVDAFDTMTYFGASREIKNLRKIGMFGRVVVYQAVVTGDARVKS